MASFTVQFKNLIKTWNLEVEDVKLVSYLCSFHEVGRKIYQRNDTKQYIYVEYEGSYSDGVDYYFKWHYITEDEANEMIGRYKNLKL